MEGPIKIDMKDILRDNLSNYRSADAASVLQRVLRNLSLRKRISHMPVLPLT